MLDPPQKRQTFFAAQMDFLEAFQQQASEHGGLHASRDEALWTRFRTSGLADRRSYVKRADRKDTAIPAHDL